MTLKPLLTLLIICSFAWQGSAQQASKTQTVLLKGLVTDKETNTPLAYVSAGILNKPLGTVTDTTGRFAFGIGPDNVADTLQLSMVGYSALKMAVKDFMARGDKPVQLTAKTQQLAEVRVTTATPKTNMEVIGRTAVSKVVQVSVHNKKSADETIGSEMGMLYKTSRQNAVIKDFNFYVSVNNFNLIKFRVNIYAVKNALPDTLLYNKQFFATLDNFKTGRTKIDLEALAIKAPAEFIVTVQWVDSRMDKKESPLTVLPVAITLFAKNCYARIASQDKWKRMGG